MGFDRLGGAGLDRWARLHIDRGGRFGSYRALGTVGFAAGLALTSILAGHLGVGARERVVLAVVPAVVFLLAVRAAGLIFGGERIVFYEQALIVIGAVAGVTAAVGGAVVATIDLAAIGVGTFLVFGRVGCFMVGCCHGRPARWGGIRYTENHARAGFTARWVGRPLFPLQLADSLLSLVLVAAGVAVLWGPHRPGDAAVLWFGGYGVGRSILELFRGDAARPYLGGLSEAQWTALAISGVLLMVRPHAPCVAASAGMLTVLDVALAIGARRRLPVALWLTNPWHVEEVGGLLVRPGRGRMLVTTLGLRVSLHELPDRRADLVLSLLSRPLTERSVRALAHHLDSAAVVLAGASAGVFHIVMPRRL